MTTIKRYHFVYRITNIITKMYYYGTRTTSKKIETKPKEDIGIKYFSTSKDKEFIKDQKENPQNYKYKVVKIFNTRKEALELEIYLHNKFNVGVNENFYNKSKQTSTGFDVTGIPKKTSTKKLLSISAKMRVVSVETQTKSIAKRKISMLIKDKNGLTGYDRKYLNTNYKKMCKKANNTKYNTIGLDGLNIIERQAIAHSKIMKVKALNGELGKSGHNNSNAIKVNIYDNNDNLMFICNGNFKEVCEVNNLPFNALKKSYKYNTRLYATSQSIQQKIIDNGHIKFKHWKAIKL